MTPELSSRQAIEEAAAFAFQGAPRAYVELEIERNDDEIFERWIYVVYGYGWRGGESDRPLNQLTIDVVEAIRNLDAGRVAVVWRHYPETHYDLNTDTSYASVRLAVVDENLCQITLDLPLTLKREGEEYPLLT